MCRNRCGPTINRRIRSRYPIRKRCYRRALSAKRLILCRPVRRRQCLCPVSVRLIRIIHPVRKTLIRLRLSLRCGPLTPRRRGDTITKDGADVVLLGPMPWVWQPRYRFILVVEPLSSQLVKFRKGALFGIYPHHHADYHLDYYGGYPSSPPWA